jgi:hypothetical protein
VVLVEQDLVAVPEPVRRYVLASGAVGRPKPQCVRVEFDADMRRRPGAPPMRARSLQFNFFGSPARLFLMTARKLGLPVSALHPYRDGDATFSVRAAGLVPVINQAGDDLSGAETVTVLNDMCFLAPGSLVDPRLSWRAVDDHQAEVTFRNGARADFSSDDRPDGSSGTFMPMRWSTPMGDYGAVGGLRLATRGRAVWDHPDGPFTYGEFRLRSLVHDAAALSSGRHGVRPAQE